MAPRTKITNEIIEQINIKYLELGTYAATAREIGISASTVKKYIVPNFIRKEDIVISTLTAERIKEVETFVLSAEDFNTPNFLMLSEEEIEGIKNLHKELVI